MDSLDDELHFAPEAAPETVGAALPPWCVLVVDDEPDVHRVTESVLRDYRFRGRGVRLISAYSAAEARQRLAEAEDIALVLVDVVMETEHAGLDLVRHIRDERGDRLVRIVLRTGQPGSAPEREVILNYEIDDYREKAELTVPRLFTTITSALRAYEQLLTVERGRRGLHAILDIATVLFRLRRLADFFAALPQSLFRVLGHGDDILVAWRSATQPLEAATIVAGSGAFADAVGKPLRELPDEELRRRVEGGLQFGESRYGVRRSTVYQRTQSQHEMVISLAHGRPLSELEQALVALFCSGAAVGLDNVYLLEQLKKSEEAAVLALAECAEFRDDSTGQHVRRVRGYTRGLLSELRRRGDFADRIDDAFADLVGLASVLHDVGKVGIRDAVLGKTAALDEAERAQMRRHSEIGERILKDAAAKVEGDTYLSIGAVVAAAHHERYDGRGYPRGLSGEQIPLAARILSVVDVFDALTMRRPYKEPWPVERALAYLQEEAGRQFDPAVVDAFVAGIEAGRIHVFKEGEVPEILDPERRAAAPRNPSAEGGELAAGHPQADLLSSPITIS